jgi:hypothetical protein
MIYILIILGSAISTSPTEVAEIRTVYPSYEYKTNTPQKSLKYTGGYTLTPLAPKKTSCVNLNQEIGQSRSRGIQQNRCTQE